MGPPGLSKTWVKIVFLKVFIGWGLIVLRSTSSLTVSRKLITCQRAVTSITLENDNLCRWREDCPLCYKPPCSFLGNLCDSVAHNCLMHSLPQFLAFKPVCGAWEGVPCYRPPKMTRFGRHSVVIWFNRSHQAKKRAP